MVKTHDCECTSGIATNNVICQGCVHRDEVHTTHVHNPAASIMEMKRDRYRDENLHIHTVYGLQLISFPSQNTNVCVIISLLM